MGYFSLDKSESRNTHKKATAEGDCSKGLAKHIKGTVETQHLVMSMGSRLQAFIDYKGFSFKY